MTRTARRHKAREDVLPLVYQMMLEMEKGIGSEREIRFHTADKMWVLRLEMIQVV